MNAKNEKYFNQFMRWHELEGSSKAHVSKSKVLLAIFLRDYVKEKDFLKLNKKDIENIWLKMSKRYTNYFSIISYVKVLRKFFRVFLNPMLHSKLKITISIWLKDVRDGK
jgi:hypothetical protein